MTPFALFRTVSVEILFLDYSTLDAEIPHVLQKFTEILYACREYTGMRAAQKRKSGENRLHFAEKCAIIHAVICYLQGQTACLPGDIEKAAISAMCSAAGFESMSIACRKEK